MLRFLTSGESHGPCLTIIMEGLPAGLALSTLAINKQLARRQSGYGRGGRMAIEQDGIQILSGLRFGQTLGSPLTMQITNKDWENWQDRMAAEGAETGARLTTPRPGHADLTGLIKYNRQDGRDILERASARETAARVAAGAVAKALLATVGIDIVSHVTSIAGVQLQRVPDKQELLGSRTDLGCVDEVVSSKMKAAVDQARCAGDSVGGVFQVIVWDVMPGLGSYVQYDRRLDGQLAGALMSVPAIKGVEIGAGFACAELPGSLVHDEIVSAEGTYRRLTNRAGGIEGGMSNGEAIVLNAAMKPIPTLMKPLKTVDIATGKSVSASTERSDVCAVPAAAVVGEAVVALVLAQALLEKFGSDCMADLLANVACYRRRIRLGIGS
jgi:chorismate synthase